MTVLKIDLDVLQTTINTYQAEIDSFKSAKKSIQKSLSSLRASGWDSGAGQAWFSLLDDEWLQNIDYQIRVLGMLRENLITAKNEYTGVYEEMQALKNSLN